MIIRNDHLFLTAAQEIRNIANPLLSNGINYFSWGRHYHDGGRIWLCNTPENLRNYYTNKLYRFGNSEAQPASYKSQIVLWSTLPNQQVFEFLKQHGTGNGIFIIESYKDYCEFTAFAINRANNAVNTFLTNMDFFKKFRDQFKEKASNLIKQSEANKIYLPYHNKALPDANILDQSILDINIRSKVKLSPQQFVCAKLLLQGKNSREMAETLSLSPRTVETYINNLKIKLNCANKTDLIVKLVEIFQTEIKNKPFN